MLDIKQKILKIYIVGAISIASTIIFCYIFG